VAFAGETYLLDWSWLFFTIWGVVLVAAALVVFGRDLVADDCQPRTNPRGLSR